MPSLATSLLLVLVFAISAPAKIVRLGEPVSDFPAARKAQLRQFYLSSLALQSQANVALLGHQDVDRVAAVLASVYPRSALRKQPFIVDAGANVGQSSEVLLNAFTEVVCRRRWGLWCPTHGVDIFALEPVTVTFEKMMLNSGANHSWENSGWKPRRIGLGDFTGVTEIYMLPSFANFQESSLSPCATMAWARYPHLMATEDVSIVTYADFVTIEGIADRDCFLLKLDLEGYDGPALDGAMPLITAGKVHWLLIEYAFKWYCPGWRHHLKGTISALDRAGMQCFVISPIMLIPISGYWWDDSIENQEHMNILCGRTSDPTLRLVVAAFNRGRSLPFPHPVPATAASLPSDISLSEITALIDAFPPKHYEVIRVPLDPLIKGEPDASFAKHRFWSPSALQTFVNNAPSLALYGPSPADPHVARAAPAEVAVYTDPLTVYASLPRVSPAEVGGLIGEAHNLIQKAKRLMDNNAEIRAAGDADPVGHWIGTLVTAMTMQGYHFPATRALYDV